MAPPTLLCSVSFPANTGFAWSTIEGMYARVADHLAGHGIRTLVAYPSLASAPQPLQGSAAIAVARPTELRSLPGVLALARWLRRENVRALYLADRETIHWGYAALRLAGVRRVVVHDHASGAHRPPRGLKWAAKWMAARTPWITGDVVVAVSDFVAERQRRVGLLPSGRIVRIYNGVRRPAATPPGALEAIAPAARGRPVIACACRCAPEKGVDVLLRAFDQLAQSRPGLRPLLVYFGDGPALGALRALRERLPSRDSIVLAGYRPDAPSLLGRARVCVVPSTWEEAFGLSVVEPMALGKLVIASRTGGIPELIEHGERGLLVPPGDARALAAALESALDDPAGARAMGERARRWVEAELTPERTLQQLLPLLEAGFESRCPAEAPPALGGASSSRARAG